MTFRTGVSFDKTFQKCFKQNIIRTKKKFEEGEFEKNVTFERIDERAIKCKIEINNHEKKEQHKCNKKKTTNTQTEEETGDSVDVHKFIAEILQFNEILNASF